MFITLVVLIVVCFFELFFGKVRTSSCYSRSNLALHSGSCIKHIATTCEQKPRIKRQTKKPSPVVEVILACRLLRAP